ncbi:MFS general substrate transporter [Lichtheimia hyalospora FSU 10163]|nr:MFS general substrate transporter [Lichtheimia hyalospora FSU 10163]
MSGITNPLYQWMSSKFNDRYLIMISCILTGLSMMLASISSEIWQLYLTIGVMNGIGSSLLWSPCVQRGLEWFSKRRALALGIITSGVGIGGLVYSNIFTACFQTIGYQNALRIIGATQFLFIAISVVACARLNTPAKKNAPILEFRVFKNKKYLIVFCLHLLCNFALRVPFAYSSSYATKLGLNAWVSGNINAIESASTIAHFAIWFTATTEGSMWAFAALQGLSQGGYMAIIVAIINDYVPLDQADAAIGWALFAWAPGGLLSQPITTYIIGEADGVEPNYRGAIIFSGTIFFVSSCLVLVLRIMRGGYQLFRKI